MNATTPPTAQAVAVRRLMAELAALGVDHVIVAPGSRSTPLAQAVAELEALGTWRVSVVLDERSAGFVATGLARAGRLPMVVCTSGTAVAELLPAVVESGESGLRWLIVAADRPARLRGLGAPQTVFQAGLLRPYAPCLEVKACDPAHNLASTLRKLRHHMHRCGPLHLNVELDLPLAMAPAPVALPAPRPPPPPARSMDRVPAPGPHERVVVIAGPLPPHPQYAQLAVQLADHAVLLAELPSNLAHAAAPRTFDTWLREPQVLRALLPDRIVRVGDWPTSKGLQLLLDAAKEHAIAVDCVEGPRRSDPNLQNRLRIRAQVHEAFAQWKHPVQPSDTVAAWRQRWLNVDALARLTLADSENVSHSVEFQVIGALLAAQCPGDALLVGNSMPIRDLDLFALQPPAQTDIFSVRGANGIDGTLATAVGLARGRNRPDAVVTVYLGDGSLLHDVGSLQLLRQTPDRTIQLLVLDNGGGAIFDYLPAAQVVPASVHDRFFTAPHGLDLPSVIRGFGIDTVDCEDASMAVSALAVRPVRSRAIVVRANAVASRAQHRAWQTAGIQCAIDALGAQS